MSFSLLKKKTFLFLLLSVVFTSYSQKSTTRFTAFNSAFREFEKDKKFDSIAFLISKFSENENLSRYELAGLNYYKSIYYKRVCRYNEAVAYSQKSLEYCNEKTVSSDFKKRNYINLADIYYTELKFELAYQYALKAKQLHQSSFYDIDNHCMLGYCLTLQRKYKESLAEFETALQLTKKYNDYCKIPEVTSKMAEVYDKMRHVKQALYTVDLAVKQADSCKELVNSINTRKAQYKILQNNAYYKEANELYDTIILLEGKYALNVRNQNMDELEAQYQNNLKTEKNNSLKLINKKNDQIIRNQRIVLVATVFAILAFCVLIFYLLRLSKKQKLTNLELEKQKAQIENNNKELIQFNLLHQKIFSVISHDFKGPITTLKLLLSNKEVEKSENSMIATYMKDVGLQLEQSDAMLESLLDWAKTELKVSVTNVVEIKLKLFVDEIIKQSTNKAKEKSITILNAIAEEELIVFPPEVLKIVLRNVVNNALKFSNPNSTVEIYCIENSIKIRDYGCGIPEKKMNKLFHQVINPGLGTQQESGFGLGLYLSYELMQKHKGTILAENHQMGGCTFSIVLP
ncbi:ATP-binding protein [Flavobacterium phycosphaerae]|uniref:ATP-binding protein n=1 Tax=Flavobacterium phycosphaerae TaxID=2697515 RepID=UPI00138AB662|nr:tetratricopeptide repeat-containing sensor histidine kinase [Flavobacterium phycosphaerae]